MRQGKTRKGREVLETRGKEKSKAVVGPKYNKFWSSLGCCTLRILSLCTLIFSWKHIVDFKGLHQFYILRMKTWSFPAVLAKGWHVWSIFYVACTALSLCHLKAMNSTIFQMPTQADLLPLLPTNAWHTWNCQQLICWSARILHYCLHQHPFISVLFLDVFEDRNSLWALHWHSSWWNNHLVWGSSACQRCRWEAMLDQSSACFSCCCKDV